MQRIVPALSPLILAAALMAGTGCAAPPEPPASGSQSTDFFGASYQSGRLDAIDAAIVRQHTIYPHHFIPDSATLTSLGERDIKVLSRHLSKYGGPLHVIRGDANSELYQARLRSVNEALIDAGVDAQTVSVSDGLPGGDGMSARDAEGLLARPDDLSGASPPPATNVPVMVDTGG